MATRDPSPPAFLRRSAANDLPQSGFASDGSIPTEIEDDLRAAMAHTPRSPYARSLTDLHALEQAITAPNQPLSAVAVAISDLRFHDAIEFAQGVIIKSDALKSIPPHELAAALNGWALAQRAEASKP